MKKTTIISSVLLALLLVLSVSVTSTAQAATAKATVKASASAKTSATAIAKGDKEIDARITTLNGLTTRIGQMMRLTDAQKTSISSEVQTLIGNLTNLKAKIDADGTNTGSSTLKDDMQSITQTYRVYALVVPQIDFVAAIDRIGAITNSLAVIGSKIEARIAAAKTAGKDTSSIETTFADYNAHIADANTKTQAALNLILPLVPDNGDATVAASNKTALTSARADIKAATADIAAARKDAGTMVKALEAFKIPGTATSTITTSAAASITGSTTAQ